MRAADFAKALHSKFDASRRDGHKTKTAGAWTRHVFPLLREIAEEHRLWWAGRGMGDLSPRYGETREYLWDFTMYEWVAGRRPVNTWNLPCVVIEHENAHDRGAFRLDHWKTLFSHAQLRVAVGYVGARAEAKRQDWVDDINVAARLGANAWHFPDGTEDLIALGYYGMTKGTGNYLFWRRSHGETQWTPLAVPAVQVE